MGSPDSLLGDPGRRDATVFCVCTNPIGPMGLWGAMEMLRSTYTYTGECHVPKWEILKQS
jgi:hypothetical protein